MVAFDFRPLETLYTKGRGSGLSENHYCPSRSSPLTAGCCTDFTSGMLRLSGRDVPTAIERNSRADQRCTVPRERGLTYQLERIPPGLMRQVKARAALEGRSVRAILLEFLQQYAAVVATPVRPVEAIAHPGLADALDLGF